MAFLGQSIENALFLSAMYTAIQTLDIAVYVSCLGDFLPLYSAHPRQQWVVSSAVEHYLDMVGVTGSIPVPPTIVSSSSSRINPPRGSGGCRHGSGNLLQMLTISSLVYVLES